VQDITQALNANFDHHQKGGNCWQNKKSWVAKVVMITIARNHKVNIGRFLEEYLVIV